MASDNKKKQLSPGFKIRHIPPGTKLDKLPDAVVDGAWTCKKGDEVIVSRRQNGKLANTLHTVMTDDKDYIELWDEEYHKWFTFKTVDAVNAGLVIKILMRKSAV